MRKWGIFFWLVLCAMPLVLAQQAGRQFQQFTTNNGLPQNSITSIYQDSRGFMWFGTRDGLSRFDGYNFKIYRYDPSDPNSLSGNYINCLTEDKEGNLWIGNVANQGLNKLNTKTGKFTQFRHEPENPGSIADVTLHDILTDKDGFIWVATRMAGLEKLDPKTGKFTHFRNNPKNPNSLATDRTASLMQDRAGNIWVGTILEGVCRLNTKTGAFSRFLVDTTRRNMAANVVYDMAEDAFGKIWLATAAGVFTLDTSTGICERPAAVAHIQDDVTAILIKDNGEIWMGGWSGLFVLDKNRKHLDTYTHNPQNKSGISDKKITRLYHDRSGITWIGTGNSGINLYDPKQQKFPLYQFASGSNQNPSPASVTAGYENPNGDLWLGIRGEGITKYNRKTGSITTYKYSPADPASVSSDNITCFLKDRQGTLWIGTEHGGLSSFNEQTGKFSRYLPDKTNPNSISHNWVLTIKEAGPHHLWIGTNGGGLEKLDKRTGVFTHFPLSPDPSKPAEGEFVIDIEQNPDGTLWIGTVFSGLLHFNPQTGKAIRYRQDRTKPGSLSYDNIGTLFTDSRGTLWVGTWGGGLNKLDKKTGKFSSYTIKNGLPSNSVFGIQEDKQQRLWISTSNGLSRFDTKTGKFKNYDVHDGLQSNEFNPFGASYRSTSGELFFGGANGLTAFFPDQIRDNTFVPPIHIIDFTVINSSEEENSKTGTHTSHFPANPDSITLSYEDNVFSIEFAALSYTDTEENQYAYKMEGFDKHWIKAGGKRVATYTNLDPGSYVFRVKASNNDGVWNEEGKAIYITILPPLWRTWWAYTLYALAFIALLFGLRRYWKRQERLKADLKLKQLESEKLHELDQLRTRFFTNISHEFRTPLTLILSPLEQLLSNSAHTESLKSQFRMMHRNAQRLLQLINQLLDVAKLEAGSMKPNMKGHDLVQFLKPLVYSFASLADIRNIKLQFVPAAQALAVSFDADMMEKIVVNLLSNAIKFTPEGGEVTVHVSAEGDIEAGTGSALITVTDTGYGIPKNRLNKIFDRFYQADSSHTRQYEGTGIGLALAKELVQLHNGRIYAESEEGKGSTFTVKLPLGNADVETVLQTATPEKSNFQNRAADAADELEIEATSAIELKSRATLPVLLIVEDNKDVRTFIRNQFIDEYKVIEAVNGKHGLKLAIELVPDLVISDLMMPIMDGIELCSTLKTDERTSHIPIILLTAKAAVENKLEGLETGADDYLTKPFQPQELQIRVKNLVEQRRKLRERFTGKTIKLEPGEVAVTSKDEQFLQRAMAVVEENMGNTGFDVETFCREIGMSRMQLHRKLKALTDQSTTEFIRNLRLKRAAQLLDKEAGNVAEVAYQCGFQSLSYFSKSFKEHFGCSPSEYQSKLSANPGEI